MFHGKSTMTAFRWVRFTLLQGLLLGLLIVLLLSCQNQQRPISAAPLNVSFSNWPGYYPVAIAQTKGFFKQQGIAVNLIFENKDFALTKQLADLVAKTTDGVFVPLGDLVAIAQRRPLYIVTAIDQSAGGDAIVARPEIKTLKDLVGKRVGSELGRFSELFVAEALKQQGIKLDSIKQSHISPQQVPQQLQNHDIEAGHTWEPYLSEAVQQGNHVIFTSKETPGLIPDVLAFAVDVVRDRPEDIQAFVKAWFQAVDYWYSHPQESKAIIAEALKLDPQLVSMDGIQLMPLAESKATFSEAANPSSLHQTVKLYNDFYINNGIISRPTSSQSLLNDTFVRAIAQ
jgi:NitT/TauT family transport system substrate-binding protein